MTREKLSFFFFLMVTEVESVDGRSGVDSSVSYELVEAVSSISEDFSLMKRMEYLYALYI